MALYGAVLRQYGLTPTAFAALPETDQSALLGYEMHRARKIAEWRNALMEAEDHKYTPDVATALFIEGL